MDIIFPPNALKCKHLTVVMYFVTVTSSICFNFILLFHQAEGRGSIWRVGYICSVSLGEEPGADWCSWSAQTCGAVQRLHRPMALVRGRLWSWKGQNEGRLFFSSLWHRSRLDAVLSQMCDLCSVVGPTPALVPKARSKAGEWEQSAFALSESIFWAHCQPALITLLPLESKWALTSGADHD